MESNPVKYHSNHGGIALRITCGIEPYVKLWNNLHNRSGASPNHFPEVFSGTAGTKEGNKFLTTLTAYSHLNASMPLDLRTER
ncbi:hypothetical protein SAMN04488505_1011176 [Chitinophaga rupis]|uniref:Uncharacterized protein n=1 Tax=Chitinophaga rupis TaxID=573321 RepID=A0A1H7L5K6_9BACT|nr:hypothetical protein SAMN04488505_1011176 [Chitinophaga rupis]